MESIALSTVITSFCEILLACHAECNEASAQTQRCFVALSMTRRRDAIKIDRVVCNHNEVTKRSTLFMTKTTTKQQVQMPSPTDLYNIEHLLDEEERMVRDTVRKFVQERVLPIIGEHFEAGTFPYELIPAIAEMG